MMAIKPKLKRTLAREILLFFAGLGLIGLVWGFLLIRNSYFDSRSYSCSRQIQALQVQLDSLPKDYIKEFYEKASRNFVVNYRLDQDSYAIPKEQEQAFLSYNFRIKKNVTLLPIYPKGYSYSKKSDSINIFFKDSYILFDYVSIDKFREFVSSEDYQDKLYDWIPPLDAVRVDLNLMKPDGLEKIYQGLLSSGKTDEKRLGSYQDFIQKIDRNLVGVYKELLDYGFTNKEIGSWEYFNTFVSGQRTGVKGKLSGKVIITPPKGKPNEEKTTTNMSKPTPDRLEKLYQNLLSTGKTDAKRLGSYKEFVQQGDKNLNRLYNDLRGYGFTEGEIGDYDGFNKFFVGERMGGTVYPNQEKQKKNNGIFPVGTLSDFKSKMNIGLKFNSTVVEKKNKIEVDIKDLKETITNLRNKKLTPIEVQQNVINSAIVIGLLLYVLRLSIVLIVWALKTMKQTSGH